VAALEPLVHARGQSLAFAGTSEPLWVDGDPARLEQVLGNLVDHVSELAGRDGVITVQLRRSAGARAEIRLRASGEGVLAPVSAPAVPRSGHSHSAVLYLVRGLVELHGGRVSARTEDMGRGSELVVELPLREAPAPDAAPSQSTERPRAATTPLRIALVDDHEDCAAGLAQLLRTWGHDVTTAGDGPNGLALLRETRPDVALLDIGLPGLDGYALARAVRATPELAHVLLIALTGFGYDQDRRKAMDAGFDVHFTKPVDLDRLRALLRTRAAHASVETASSR
jgi:CheY-like chemotaxis protein